MRGATVRAMKPVPSDIPMRVHVGDWFGTPEPVPGSFQLNHDDTYLFFRDPYGVDHNILVAGQLGWKWDGNKEQPTVTPSIRHVAKEGWHGFITKGVLTSCSDSGNQA